MRESLDHVLRDATLVTLAFAIALGWALFQVAHGLAQLISTALIAYPSPVDVLSSVRYTYPLTWVVHDRILTFGPLLEGLVELAVVLTAAVLVYRRSTRA
jgi:hypothetical protein